VDHKSRRSEMRADRADPDISSLRSRVLPCLLPPIDCLGATTLSELSLRYGRKLSLLLSLSLSLSLEFFTAKSFVGELEARLTCRRRVRSPSRTSRDNAAGI